MTGKASPLVAPVIPEALGVEGQARGTVHHSKQSNKTRGPSGPSRRRAWGRKAGCIDRLRRSALRRRPAGYGLPRQAAHFQRPRILFPRTDGLEFRPSWEENAVPIAW